MKPALLKFIATTTIALISQISFAQCDTSKVADLTADHITHTSTRFTWDPHPQAAGYDYGINTSTTPPSKGHTTINTSILQQGLSPNVNYCVHVRAHCAGGGFSQWQTTCFTTPSDPSGITTVKEGKISIYPNPAADFLNVETPTGRHTVTIRDLVGRTVMEVSTNKQVNTIDMLPVRQGLYFVTVSGEGYSRTQRVTKK